MGKLYSLHTREEKVRVYNTYNNTFIYDDDIKSGTVSLSKIWNDYENENDKMIIAEIEYKELIRSF